MVERLSYRSQYYHLCIFLLFAASFVVLSPVEAQQVDLPAGSDADHKRLMQIRAEAQTAQQDAQIAALRRTAAQSTDQSNRDRVLEQARLDKEFKRRAALAVQQQQAINAYEKVKQAEINSWKGKGRKISSGVPANFTASLPPLEEGTVKKKGLLRGVAGAPGKALKGLASLRPGFLTKKKRTPTPESMGQFAPPESLTLESSAPRIPAPEPPSPVENETIKEPGRGGFRIPLLSKLTGGKKNDENPYIGEEDSSMSPEEIQAAAVTAAGMPPEKKGFLGLGSRGKKNRDAESDAYYGPDGGLAMEQKSKSGFLSKFSLKKNKDSDDQGIDGKKPPANNSSREDIYIVDSRKAQFFPFGKSGQQADAQALGEGTIVRMTKSGDDWSSVELSSGNMGVMRNKYLRRAKSREIPSNMFVHQPKTPYPTTARISKPRSATGKGASHRYREPVNVPLPDLPVGGTEMDTPIGNGLLPPLTESVIQ